MKKLIVVGMGAALLLAALLTGCASKSPAESPALWQAQETEPAALQDSNPDRPDSAAAPGQDGDQMPLMPNPLEDGNNKEPGGSSRPSVETDTLFSARDLNCAPDLSEAIVIPAGNNSEYTITAPDVYVLTGKAENFTVMVEADKNEDKVQLVLSDAEITNDNLPVIYVKSADKCFVTTLGSNTLSVSNLFLSDGDVKTDAVIFSKADLTLNGIGALTILSAAGNGITGKDDMKFTGGTYRITSAGDAVEANDSISVYQSTFVIETAKDGFHCENDNGSGSICIRDGSFTITAKDDGIQATDYLIVDGGQFTITAAEGIEATYIQINDGSITINTSDDGINAARKSNNNYDVVIEINGGEITIAAGPGDTDCLDANGTIIVNGGTIDVTGSSAFDADSGTVYNGGTIRINGVTVDSIPSSMPGGHGGPGDFGRKNGGRPDGGKGDPYFGPKQQPIM